MVIAVQTRPPGHCAQPAPNPLLGHVRSLKLVTQLPNEQHPVGHDPQLLLPPSSPPPP